MDVGTYIFIITINSQTTIQNCLTKFIPLPINFRISKLSMHFQNLIFVTSFEAYMAMHLVWKGRQLIIHLFNTVGILLLSGFLHMYMYSVCSYFYVCSCV